MKLQSILLTVALGCVSAPAQDMSKTIIIDREIVPTLRAATRLNNFPQLIQPSIADANLTFSDQTTAGEVPALAAMLPAASPGYTIAPSPYRGYVSAGYFPVFNVGASAGYSIIDKPLTRLNAWLQYDGNSYKTHLNNAEEKSTLKRNTFTIGVDFSNIFRNAGRLDVSTFYTLNSLNRPWLNDNNTGINQFELNARWSARKEQVAYYVGADFATASFSRSDAAFSYDPQIGKVAESRYDFKAGAAYLLTRESNIGLNLSADLLHLNSFNMLLDNNMAVAGPGKTIGLFTIAPAYRLRQENLRVKIGLRAQITTHSGKTFHVAPDIRLDYRPTGIINLDATLGGGEHLNTLSSLINVTPYLSPSLAYNNSHIPFTAEIGANFGPITGISAGIHGGFAVANDWLMPTAGAGTYLFEATNLRAFYARVDAAWKYSDLLTLRADVTLAPGSRTHAYYLNRDRAKAVVNICASVTPIARLKVDAGWQLRAGRSAWLLDGSRYGLGTMSSLNIGGEYAFSDAFTVFVRCENLLNTRPDLLPGLEAQGIKGLAGVALKF